MKDTSIAWVSVIGGTWRDRVRIYRAALRLQRRFNRSTPEQQDAILEALMRGGAREVRDDR